MFRTSNPAFRSQEVFAPAQTWDDLRDQGRLGDVPVAAAAGVDPPAPRRTMTIQGTVNKSFFLLAVCITTAVAAWGQSLSAEPVVPMGLLLLGGLIAGFITAMVCIFAPRTAPITAPLYAAFQGLFLGAISAVYAVRFGGGQQVSAGGGASAVALNTGLIFNAMLLTFGILGGLLVAYSARLIRPGPVFRNAVVTATLGVCVYAVVALVAAMFGSFSLASVFDPSNGGMLSIGVSVLLVVIASANLVLDFDFIHNAAKNGAPRHMEWYGAFGLMVTLIWLYLEVLRLLAKMRRE